MLYVKMIKKRQLLNKTDILKYISAEHKETLKELTIFREIGSTNDVAKTKLTEIKNPNDSLAIFAEQQTSGRGRSGKTWESPANVNIYLSYGWHSSLKLSNLEGLSLASGVEISDCLYPIIEESLKIKWPNDLFLSEKKTGGILVETSSNKIGTSIVIGVGLNVLMSGKETNSIDQDWTSLSIHFGKDFDKNQIAGLILEALSRLKNNFESKGFSHYKDRFEELDILKNKECLATFDSASLIGLAEGITERGELILNEQGKIHQLRYGDVSIRKI